VLRALKRASAAFALAAFLAVGTAALVAAEGDREPDPRAPSPSRPDATRGQTGDRRGTDPGQSPGRGSTRHAPVRWRRSVSVGLHWRGRLIRGVQLPADGRKFFTWDPILRRAPNRAWRRWGNDRLVRTLLRVLAAHRAAHPDAPRVGVGDLSRPNGGDFGPRYGLPGHVSHQNGLDADVYYPRRDRLERAPLRPEQIDRRLAQDLVDRFVAAGAISVFVGPSTGLRGPPHVVQELAHHDNHLHVRLPIDGLRTLVNRVHGHAVTHPAAWDARVGPAGTTFVSSAPLPRRLDSPFAITVDPDGALLWLSDYGRVPGGNPPPRPRRFRLRPATPFEGGTRRVYSFSIRSHAFQAWLKLGARADARTRARALAVLDSLRLTPRAFQVANLRSVRVLGRTTRGRPIRAFRVGNPRAARRVLVVGCIHGTECAGLAVTGRLLNLVTPIAADLWIVQNLNPDGLALGVRQNGRGVDLNRNFPSEWRPLGRRWDPQFSGPNPFSEPETRAAADLVAQIRPSDTIWFHQPQALVRAWGQSIPAARRYARLARMPFRAIRWPRGTAPNWQNHRFPGTSSFVVELPAGELTHAAAERHVRAILAFTE
jgi:Zinc carboxypeptidase/Penicillin-insensitive murein endopeptidase